MTDAPLLFFDGVCNLCDASVGFVLDHDPQAIFRFAPLQSNLARTTMAQHGLRAEDLDTVVLVDDGRAYTRSTAVLKLLARLPAPWSWLSLFLVVPRPLRDLVYRFVARNRLRWFGIREACRVPTPELRARFLDTVSPPAAPAALSTPQGPR
jgi:predicted DCC family thiol-disulfide oxidoreductase YuxK